MFSVIYRGKVISGSRRKNRLIQEEAQYLAVAFMAACEGCGLAVETTSAAGIRGSWNSEVTSVNLDNQTLTVRMRSGLVLDDFQANASRIAEALGVPRVRFTQVRPGMIRVHMLDKPEFVNVPTPPPITSVCQPVLLGTDEDQVDVHASLMEMLHTVVQGQTRSGKSFWCYALLSQLAGCEDLLITGCDPSGLLLKPFAKSFRHGGWQALGMSSVDSHVFLLERLVRQMDARIAELPEGQDYVAISRETPLILVVLEEFAGLIRQANREQKSRLLALYGRLVAEGAKAGIRVLAIVQRADAEILDGYSRGQFSTRVSFRVDSESAVAMLHPNVPDDVVADHLTSPTGVALVSVGGSPAVRIAAPNVGSYSAFAERVSA